MDAASSFQVLVAVAILTIALIAITRLVGLGAATHHADLPPIPSPSSISKVDMRRLVAILTAAAMEALESENVTLTSITELAPDSGHHWPRLGRFQRHHGRPDIKF